VTRRVLAISAHPDDETLGCGGGLLRHQSLGDEIHWLIVTDPWHPMFEAEQIDKRQQEIADVADAYRMTSCHRAGLPTTKLDNLPLGEVIDPIRDILNEVQPDIIYVVHRGDVHSDHRVTFDATIAAAKPFRSSRVASIYSYECTSSTNMAPPTVENAFLPQVYCDVSAYVERKLEVLSIYESEIHQPPHPRSLDAVRSLARYRGATINVDYAEAYQLVRDVWS
jgi:LmbE family N-acetylglucosaminyl deacetylase